MARNNAARKPTSESALQPEVNKIQQKKEQKKIEIAKVFEQAKDRVKGKELEMDKMRLDLTKLLNQIPDQEGGVFDARLREFVLKFDKVKKHLDNLVPDENLEEMPAETIIKTDPVKAVESLPIDKNEGLSEVKNFIDKSGARLDGVINEKVKGKKTFRGFIKFSEDRGVYTGFAAFDSEGNCRPEGDGEWVKADGDASVGFFKDGYLNNGHSIQYLKNGELRIGFIKDYVIKIEEQGNFDDNNELSGIGSRYDFQKNTKQEGNFKDGELDGDGVITNVQKNIKQAGEFKNGRLINGVVSDLNTGKLVGHVKDGRPVKNTNAEKVSDPVDSSDKTLPASEAVQQEVVEHKVENTKGFLELKDFKNADGEMLNGTVLVDEKGKKTFRGVVEFSNGAGKYNGFSVLDSNDRPIFEGDGVYEKDNQTLDGFFKGGYFDHGYAIYDLKNGSKERDTVANGKSTIKESGLFYYQGEPNTKGELEGTGERKNYEKGTVEKGEFKVGKLEDGYVYDFDTGKPIERWENGMPWPLEIGDNSSVPETNLTGSVDTGGENVDPQEQTKLKQKTNKEQVDQIIEEVSKLSGLDGFVDASGKMFKGRLIHTPEGEHIFDGEIKTDWQGSVYQGQARLDADGIFKNHGQGKTVFDGKDGRAPRVAEGEWENGIFKNGIIIATGDRVGWGSKRAVYKVENGEEIERAFDLDGVKDADGTVFSGQMYEEEDTKDNSYVGQFTMNNGSVYKGEAWLNRKGQFEFVPGKSERIKSATVIDKFKDLFKFGKKKNAEVVPVVSKEQAIPPEQTAPQTEGENVVAEAIAKRIIEKVSKLDKLEDFQDAYGQHLNGKVTHTKDGKHIFEGKVKFLGEPAYEYEGKAVLNADGMFELFDESQTDKSQSKEKGRLGKMADVIFSKAGAKIASEGAYKTTASILGVKLGTDVLLAGVAHLLEKKSSTKDLAAKIGEFSDVHKFLVGKNEINAIKEGFAEFMKTLNPEDGEDFELNLVDEKYSALKSKIESAGQIDPEAKGKLLAKLEKIKQNFDTENKKLDDAEKAEAAEFVKAYSVNRTAGMQLWRDGLNGSAKLIVVAATIATGGAAGGAALAAKQAASMALLAKSAAIGRVMGMATTKIIERGQKNKRFNEQMKLEEKEAVGTLKDFKFALLETMHGLSGGLFNGGKDVKIGKNLTGIQRLGNFAKSMGNVLVAVGVTLGIQGETVGSVASDFVHKFQDANGGEVQRVAMENLSNKLPSKIETTGVTGAAVPDNAPAAAAIAATEAKAAAVADSAAAEPVNSSESSDSVSGAAATAETAPIEQAGGNSVETLFIKDMSKVRDFASWRHQMMEQNMGYKFEGGKIGHALMFHKGAQIELVDHDGKVVDTYTFKKGGSTWAAMDKFHRKHLDLFKDKDNAPGIKIIDTGDDKHPTVEVLNKYKMESHQSGHSAFKEGGATAKSSLDKVISDTKLSKPTLHEQKIGVGPNIQKGIPAGWAATSEQGPNGQAMVDGFADKEGHARFLIHSTDSSSEFDVDRDMRMVDASSGKIFDLDGNHVGDLDIKPTGSLSATAGAATADRIVWSSGGNVAEQNQADLKAHIIHRLPEKGVVVENTARIEKTSGNGGGGAPKENAVVGVSAEQAVEARPRVKADVKTDSEVKPKDEAVVEEAKVDKQVAAAETAPVAKEITSLEDGREAIVGMEGFDAEEKMRLTNFSHLLEWQRQLYGQDGSALRNILEGQGELPPLLDKDEINKMMADLARGNALASKEFMKGLQDGMSYQKIIEKLNHDMPGYSIFHSNEGAGFTNKVFETDLSQKMSENVSDFRKLEVGRVKDMLERAQNEKYLRTRTASAE